MASRITRTKGGKLAKKNYNIDVLSENEEEDMGTQIEGDSVKEIVASQAVATKVAESSEMVSARPIFEKFKTKAKLEAGLCIVRPLGNGKYELINLTKTDHEAFTSEETGRRIRRNTGRMAAINLSEDEWKAAKFMSDQAIRSADDTIYRLKKVPIELRMIIYEMVLVSDKPLAKVQVHDPSSDNFALLRTCKWIHAEAAPILWKNSFILLDVRKKWLKPFLPQIKVNMTSMALAWPRSNKAKEATVFKFLTSCDNLETITITLDTYWIERYGPQMWNYVPQTLFQNEPSAANFCQLPGFDNLVKIRGLKKHVKIDATSALNPGLIFGTVRSPVKFGGRHQSAGPAITIEMVKAFEAFLTKTLRQPKPAEPVKVHKTLPLAVAKRKRTSDDDDDASGTYQGR